MTAPRLRTITLELSGVGHPIKLTIDVSERRSLPWRVVVHKLHRGTRMTASTSGPTVGVELVDARDAPTSSPGPGGDVGSEGG